MRVPAAARGVDLARANVGGRSIHLPPSETHPDTSATIRQHMKQRISREVQEKASEQLRWKDKARKRAKEEAMARRKARVADAERDDDEAPTEPQGSRPDPTRPSPVEQDVEYGYSLDFVRDERGVMSFEACGP
jgi:hypothetical protein